MARPPAPPLPPVPARPPRAMVAMGAATALLVAACFGAAFRSQPSTVAAAPRTVAPSSHTLATVREELDEEPPAEPPARPSHGAIASALRAVLPDARACLGPDDGAYRATVTFDATGAVSRVSFADEDDAAACVRAHLATARVDPFADAPYVATITVRP